VDVRIREATKEDFNELWRIDQQCFEPGISYSRRELAWYMNLRGAFTLVGESQEKPRSKWEIVGFAVGQQPRRGLGHIVTIDVLPEARRSGLGTRLMEEIETRLKSTGCEVIFLETAVDNGSAIKFYKRLGYHVVKTIPRYYLGKVDAIMMAKRLRARTEGHGKKSTAEW
jgi:ribosomal-protein-alanine N-acetyltransferase